MRCKGEGLACSDTVELCGADAVHEHFEIKSIIPPIIGPENVILRTFGQAPRPFGNGLAIAVSAGCLVLRGSTVAPHGGISAREDRTSATRISVGQQLPVGLVCESIGDHVDGHFHFARGALGMDVGRTNCCEKKCKRDRGSGSFHGSNVRARNQLRQVVIAISRNPNRRTTMKWARKHAKCVRSVGVGAGNDRHVVVSF